MSFVNDWRQTADGSTPEEKPTRRNVDVVYLERPIRPKWENPQGFVNEPKTWTDAAGFLDVEVTTDQAFSLGFGIPPVRRGDVIRGCHPHLIADVLGSVNHPVPHLRKIRILGEGTKPSGGYFDVKIERGLPDNLPTGERKRLPKLVALAQLGNAHAARELTERGVAVPPPLPALAAA